MTTARLYLDTRATKEGAEAPIKIAINKRGSSTYIRTGHRIPPACWDSVRQRVVKHPAKDTINADLLRLLSLVRSKINELVLSGEAAPMTVTQIKNRIAGALLPEDAGVTLGDLFERVSATKSGSTKENYLFARKALESFRPLAFSRPVGAFGADTAESFDEWIRQRYARNTRNSIINTVGAVFNAAVKEKIIIISPFAGLHSEYVRTRRRDLDRETFARFWNADTLSEKERRALDVFKISFLMRAANLADIYGLRKEDIYNGRIMYKRRKTGKDYSIKIEPELSALLDEYGAGGWLVGFLHEYANPTSATSSINFELKTIAKRTGGIPEDITLYFARHTLASLAMELEISVDMIGQMLGHTTGSRVTLGYIDVKDRQTDTSARRVYDYALYNIR